SRSFKAGHRLPECGSFRIVPKQVTDLVAGNCSFADDLPSIVSVAEIDDGSRHLAGRGTSVHDHADAFAHLSSHALRGSAIAGASQAGRSSGDGKSEGLHDCDGNA